MGMPKYGQLPKVQRLPEAPERGAAGERADGGEFYGRASQWPVSIEKAPPPGVDIYAPIFFNKLHAKSSHDWRYM